MALCVNHHVWLAIRRVGETMGQIAALEDIRLRLIEMRDTAAVAELMLQMERLKTGLDYHQNVLVAVRARLARSQPVPDAGTAINPPWPRPRPSEPLGRFRGPRAVAALPEAEGVAG